ncbi:heterokaryon incompatibility protein-domain-containing protein [Lophiotrema nucula]|uniref:Heterokaryon incompatibility protein-domain-containing protein n=1 Tax=Lophiotrema nucula TaxID=690887 RepID=A0A6A5YP39_9PLEO|nr:heterokaryon incompatibility protein-domain-containing protein [Lophiotrema nucula]
MLKRKRELEPQIIYSPIPGPDYIRIIKLLPGQKTDGIKCKLVIMPVGDDTQPYEAISYVWGDPNDTAPIECNGSIVQVTRNLEDALRIFRYETRERTLWADAICINQQDSEEKNQQVRRMDQVFRGAVRVLAWLATDPQGIAGDCFQLIVETNKHLDQRYLEEGYVPIYVPLGNLPFPIEDNKDHWKKVGILTDLEWFKRAWIVQEIALARECELYWGTHNMDIAHVFELACWLYRNDVLRSQLVAINVNIRYVILIDSIVSIHTAYSVDRSWKSTLPLLENIFERRKGSPLFVEVLKTAKDFKASKGEDHVYAFLGSSRATDEETGNLLIDPEYGLGIDDAYFNIACALLQNRREGPWLLTSVDHTHYEDSSSLHRPSWVPRWNIPQYGWIAASHFWYRAGGTESSFCANVHGKTLRLSGVVLDIVTWTSPVFKWKNVRLDIAQWDEELRTTGDCFVDLVRKEAQAVSELDEDEYSLTLLLGYNNTDPLQFSLDQHRNDWNAYLRQARAAVSRLNDNEASDNQVNDKSQDLVRVNFIASQLEYCHDKRLVHTQDGRIGIVPRITKVDDVCCIILGSSVPFILRPIPGSSHYLLVGECYIHNVMRGEILADVERGRYKTETITLE